VNRREIRKKIADIRQAGSYGKRAREEQQRRERVGYALDKLAEWKRDGIDWRTLRLVTEEERDALSILLQMEGDPRTHELERNQRERRKEWMGGGAQ
jgi:hypothetical protein